MLTSSSLGPHGSSCTAELNACRAVPELMKDLPLKKIRNFGGKMGTELEALGCNTAGDVLALPPGQLHQNFGERTSWILYTLQGNSDEAVQVHVLPVALQLLQVHTLQNIVCTMRHSCWHYQAS